VKAGTDCIAVVSAICAAHDPEAAARRINDIICSALTVPNI
jgi:thiamine monophosphate synthase